MLRELDIMLGLINQEWSYPQAEEPLPRTPVDEPSGVYPIGGWRRLEPEANRGLPPSFWRRARTSLAKMLSLD